MYQMIENEESDPKQNFPKGFLQLCSIQKIVTACDGLKLLLHTILLEVGFIPKDVTACDIYKCMPENWNSSGIFKIQYSHKDIPEVLCWVTCVPLYKNLTIQGTLITEQLEDNNVHMKLSVDSYLKEKEDVSNPSELYINIKRLRRIFKDQFCFGVLVLMQDIVKYKPAFGLNGLVDDVKSNLLKLLPVEAVVSLSRVNKHFHKHANLNDLWKFMYLRDYDSGESTSHSDKEDWKELYKTEYLKRKRQYEFRHTPCVFPSHYIPQIYPVGPNFDMDPTINMDPALQVVFPHMRGRFRQSRWPFTGWNGGFQYFGRFW